MKKTAIFLSLVMFITGFCINASAAPADGVGYLASETAVLIDADTGTVLYDKNMNRKMHPASITKIMTGMLALELCDTDEVMTASHNAVYSLPYNTSHIALNEGEQITLEQGLYALGIESANDAANVIAEHIGGTTEAFATVMTQKARQLGANNTNFTNPHGLPDDNHYTTAYDMALIAAAAVKTEGFNKYFSAARYDIPPTNLRDVQRQFWNANYFLNGYEECEGILMSKTGWTTEAQHTLVTAAERDGLTLIAVVMYSTGKSGKYDDTLALFDYGFANYQKLKLSANEVREKLSGEITLSDGRAVAVPAESILNGAAEIVAPSGTKTEDISVSVGMGALNGAGDIATTEVTFMYSSNGAKIPCGKQVVTILLATAEEEKGFDIMAFAAKAGFVILNIFLWGIIAILSYIALKQVVILENRRRIRKRKREQLGAKRQNEQQKRTVYRK